MGQAFFKTCELPERAQMPLKFPLFFGPEIIEFEEFAIN